MWIFIIMIFLFDYYYHYFGYWLQKWCLGTAGLDMISGRTCKNGLSLQQGWNTMPPNTNMDVWWHITGRELPSFWQNFLHWLHWKLSNNNLCYSQCRKICQNDNISFMWLETWPLWMLTISVQTLDYSRQTGCWWTLQLHVISSFGISVWKNDIKYKHTCFKKK